MRIVSSALAAALLLAAAGPVFAGGTADLKKADGSSIRIICNPTACQITFFDKAGNKVKMESADGGDYGYAVAKEKYYALGYK